MGFDNEPDIERGSKGSKPKPSTMTLQKAVDMGEYEPEYLATFAEWHTLSPHVQLQNTLDDIHEQLRKIERDRERIYSEYSNKS